MSAVIFFAAACYAVFGVGFAGEVLARQRPEFRYAVTSLVAFQGLAVFWPIFALLHLGKKLARGFS